MSVIGNPLLLGGADAAFTTQRSVRLRSSASAYFNRTPASASNRKKWTWSAWVKVGDIANGSTLNLFSSGDGTTNNYCRIQLVTNFLQFINVNAAASAGTVETLALFRDPTAYYHFMVTVDTANTTANDRAIIYVNGVRQNVNISTAVTINSDTWVNSANAHYIGRQSYSATSYFDGYITEINFVDGQALTPSSFGEYDSVRNTQWKPKAYSGTYGTNGFYLKFADNSAATAAALGKDSSGNGNNWTPNNISLTAGATYDSMTDVPTLTSETASNFAVMNPLARSTFVASSSNPSTGNLVIYQATTASWAEIIATMGASSGKWYWEIHCSNLTSTSNLMLGVVTEAEHSNLNSSNKYVGSNTAGYGYYSFNGNKYNNGSATAYGSAYVDNDIVGVALDMDAGTLTFYKNGVSQGVAFSGITGIMFPAFSSVSGVGNVNFGQRPFSYPLAGHKSFNTFNLPDGAVPSSDDYHKVYTYTGNGGGLQVGEIQKPASLFNLDRSLRLRSSNSAYLNRTFSSSPTTFTFSCWVKRGTLGVQQIIAASRLNGAQSAYLLFNASDQLQFLLTNGTLVTSSYVSTAVFRDPSSWYHVVFSSTAGGTGYVYVNNVQVVSGSVPAGYWLFTNTASWVNAIGRLGDSATSYLDGYLADVYFIDGQALTPTDFGQYDGNYYWTPKAYTGTYGTNGFHLEFEDFSAATAAAIGKDTSGQGNNWTPNNINLTTPASTNISWDSAVDVPTLTSTDVSNFCTLDPLRAWGATVVATLTEANQKLTSTGGAGARAFGTMGMTSGKWYWEAQWTAGASANMSSGVTKDPVSLVELIGFDANSWGYYVQPSNLGAWNNGSRTVIGSAFTANSDVLGVAFDADIGSLYFYKNGTLIGSGAAFTGLTNATFYPAISANGSTSVINFGQRPFAYTPPTGFKSLNSFNIAEVTGDVESPDFVWIKSRSAGTHHALFNSVTGVGKYLQSSNAVVEVADVNSLIQFNKNGFLLGNAAIVNTLSATYVAAAWKVAATTVTNTNGTISSQVRSNSTNGISIVTWTGNNTNNSTIGHGFTSLTPKVIFAKRRDTTGSNWIAMHSALATDNNLFLSGTGLTQAISAISGGGISTTVTPTTFTVKQGTTDQSNVNASGTTYVAYCFAEIAGFSKFTSYAANASSTDGPFVACGFAPRWIMIKRATGASGTGGWIMYDTSRSTYNTMSEYLFAEGAAGFGTLAAIDVTANGFKIRSNNVHLNQTAGDVYIVMAFAEHPFKYALAR